MRSSPSGIVTGAEEGRRNSEEVGERSGPDVEGMMVTDQEGRRRRPGEAGAVLPR
jgi:hypothetical protein